MKKQKSVALLIETSNAYARNLLGGILSYINAHESWSIDVPEQQRGAAPPDWLDNWKGDGLIVRIETERIARFVQKLNVPVVDVSAARFVPNIPFVETDDKAIAKLAFEHFQERGFEHFAFCGDSAFKWSALREASFSQAAKHAGRECHVFHAKSRTTPGFSLARERARLTRWLKSLPRPVAVFACYDIKAQQILDVCRQQDIRAPEDVAVLGVDDDELLCGLCTPPLSSVIPAAHKAGQEAARLLDSMMSGIEIDRLEHLMEPLGIATRQSTDVLAIADPDIADAVRFIRDSACEGIDVNDVLQRVALSRRVLETRFKQFVGRTPHQEIVRRRVERIRRYLLETDLTLGQIAQRTGFQNEEYMSVTFRRAMGLPPGRYRREQSTSSTSNSSTDTD
ncbi:LacI family transcriptional regulator [Neorhodopirellula lusitana]|uniref:LacI family transcriptional regulator n=1 Tax=Neorhodopirellula lusitana TaxID=445327 RepID=A0ABY1QDM5_9BACT|nr:DNA-binding transcriptional regulator [Neorhodopirellula lusitana]SMP66808.1 LacI family transcriptional regulator [Neorhodopirellula lusitana]